MFEYLSTHFWSNKLRQSMLGPGLIEQSGNAWTYPHVHIQMIEHDSSTLCSQPILGSMLVCVSVQTVSFLHLAFASAFKPHTISVSSFKAHAHKHKRTHRSRMHLSSGDGGGDDERLVFRTCYAVDAFAFTCDVVYYTCGFDWPNFQNTFGAKHVRPAHHRIRACGVSERKIVAAKNALRRLWAEVDFDDRLTTTAHCTQTERERRAVFLGAQLSFRINKRVPIMLRAKSL